MEYDFLTWTSFPSSARLETDLPVTWWGPAVFSDIPVRPGATIRIVGNFKQKGVTIEVSRISIRGSDGVKYRWISELAPPKGTFEWKTFEREFVVPSDVIMIGGYLGGGGGTPTGVTWFDDLKIYQDGVLIYSNDFSNWDPMIGAGVGAPIGGVAGYLLKEPLGPMVSEAVGAVLGGALGGGVGLLTGMGIIPVPQIPSLGAAPEEPGAPARLGKYQITG